MTKKIPDPIDRHVGSRVRLRRLTLGMSQEKLADALQLTFQQVQKYEKGANRIGAGRLMRIARILQVPPSFFFEGLEGGGGDGPTLAGELLAQFFTLPGAGELAQHYTALADDSHARSALLNVARALAERPSGAAQREAA